jgi:hypothetical protein
MVETKYFIGVDTISLSDEDYSAMVVAKHTGGNIEIVSYNSCFSKSKWYEKAKWKYTIGMIYWKYFRKNTTFIIEKDGRRI